MTLIVTRHIEGHYEVEVAEPQKTWVEILGGKLLCDDVTVLSLAVERGLLELMKMFGQPERPEGVT